MNDVNNHRSRSRPLHSSPSGEYLAAFFTDPLQASLPSISLANRVGSNQADASPSSNQPKHLPEKEATKI